jgi:hypothetical protein
MRGVDTDFLIKFTSSKKKFDRVVLKESFLKATGDCRLAIALQLLIDNGYIDNWTRTPIAIIKYSGIFPEVHRKTFINIIARLRKMKFIQRQRVEKYKKRVVYKYRVNAEYILEKRLIPKGDLYG